MLIDNDVSEKGETRLDNDGRTLHHSGTFSNSGQEGSTFLGKQIVILENKISFVYLKYLPLDHYCFFPKLSSIYGSF